MANTHTLPPDPVSRRHCCSFTLQRHRLECYASEQDRWQLCNAAVQCRFEKFVKDTVKRSDDVYIATGPVYAPRLAPNGRSESQHAFIGAHWISPETIAFLTDMCAAAAPLSCAMNSISIKSVLLLICFIVVVHVRTTVAQVTKQP